MERFDIGVYLKTKYNIQQYPFAENAQLPLNMEKIKDLLDNIHEHYCHEAMGDGGNNMDANEAMEAPIEKPELVTEEYAFKKQEEAEVINLRSELDELGVVLRGFHKLIGSGNYIVAYTDRRGVACHGIGGGLNVKDMLYLNTILSTQVSIAFQRSGLPEGN